MADREKNRGRGSSLMEQCDPFNLGLFLFVSFGSGATRSRVRMYGHVGFDELVNLTVGRVGEW